MSDFCLKKICEHEILNELQNIGFEESYIETALKKYKYINIKIFKLSLPQANILKQTALSLGADCAVNKGVLTSEVQFSDCILGGSFSQIKNIIEKLKYQQFSMPQLAEQLEKLLLHKRSKTKIVGILNLTDNSFSDGGIYNNFDSAIKHICEMIEDGADIIDIGAESTKPYSEPVSAESQIERIEPILKYLQDKDIKIPISIDTRSSLVAARVLNYGVSIINDVSGLDFDKQMINVIADNSTKVVIQHSQGTPENMQNNPQYKNVIDDVYLSLHNKIEYAISRGINKKNIIADVGIGFGKTQEQNFKLIKRISEFKSLGCELMLGISRKSFLGMNDVPNDEKDIYTLALNALAIERKVDYIRVHNVKLHRKMLDLMKNFKEL